MSHELLGRLSPNGGDSDDPLNVSHADWVVGDGHVCEFPETCVSEEAEGVREHNRRSHSFPIGCLQFHALVQLLFMVWGREEKQIVCVRGKSKWYTDVYVWTSCIESLQLSLCTAEMHSCFEKMGCLAL